MLNKMLYGIGAILIILAILSVVGLFSFPWPNFLVVGIICVVAAYVLGRGRTLP